MANSSQRGPGIAGIIASCRLFAELAPHALLLTVGQGHVVCYVNPAFCRLTGMSEHALLDLPLVEAFPECAENGAVALLDRVYSTGELCAIAAHPMPTNAAQPAPLCSYAAWPVDGGQEPRRLFLEVSDCTERALNERDHQRTTEEMLRANERLVLAGVRMQELADEAEAATRRMALLGEASRVLTSSLDASGTLGHVAELAVPELGEGCAIFAVDEQGSLRKVAAASDPSLQAGEWTQRLDQALDLAAHTTMACRRPLLMTAPGAPPPLGEPASEAARRLDELGFPIVLSFPLEGRARALGVLSVIARDRRIELADVILARELADRIALATERAALYTEALEAVRARDDLLACVSHDLRNPLTAIVMSAGILSNHLPAEALVQAGQHVDRIKRTAEHMRRLIQDLVESARIAAGGLPLDRQQQPVVPLLTEAIEMLEPLATRKRIQIERDIADNAVAALASVDRARLVQVFTNLIDNAIKLTPEQGSITASAELSESRIQISIRDTGPGISRDDLPHLFDRFWQARKTARLGVGLGLFIARGIVEAHDGRIWAESEPGAGCVFFVALPLAKTG